jgi:hypothetical protein
MPKLSRMSGQDAINTLERLGFVQVRQKGSHWYATWYPETGSINGRRVREEFIEM